jgi:plasmid stability protein
MADVKIRKLDDWVVHSFRAEAERAGRSPEAELRLMLTEVARERRAALVGEINAFRDGLRARYGQMSDPTHLIREIGLDSLDPRDPRGRHRLIVVDASVVYGGARSPRTEWWWPTSWISKVAAASP